MADKGIGDRFQQETKYIREEMDHKGLDCGAEPDAYKEYPDAELLILPPPEGGKEAFSDVVRSRKSIRKFSSKQVTCKELSFLLYACSGIRRKESRFMFRTVPSAGALYPVETYIVINTVDTVPQGMYHYNIRKHGLECMSAGDLRADITEAALGQDMCGSAACVLIWTAVFERCKWKYGQRAYRYVYLDAGHIGAHLSLAAAACNLGSCQIGALYDEEVNKLVGVDGIEESVVYMTAVGHPG